MNWNDLMCSERCRIKTHKQSNFDLRTEFEKDYHRIISSASFRRLQDKTQVFPLDKSDFIRTRLTHSLEVSSFAKSLGQSVGSKILSEGLDSDFTIQTQMDISDVLQCAGLLHDIGNPPFGHFGESAIQDWFKENLSQIKYDNIALSDILDEQMISDLTHFEGNTQALRVVSKLHFLVDENGMNLTKALMCTMIKYPGSSLEINYDKNDPNRDIRHKKMGYFLAEKELFDDIQSSCKTNNARHPLAFLLEAADDIAYTTADIEDAVKKGLISYDTLAAQLREGCLNKDVGSSVKKLISRLEVLYQRAIDNSYENPYLYAVQNWIVSVQGAFLNAATDSFISNYQQIMNGTFRYELLYCSEVYPLLKTMQEIAYEYAFISKPILMLEVKAASIFDFLIGRFVNSFLYYDTPLWKDKKTAVDEKIVMLMSENYKRVYHMHSKGKSDAEKLYLRLLMVTDYISGMTDSFAAGMYEEMK